MSLLILDWDDTLCPTTWLYQTGLAECNGPVNKNQYELLHICATHINAVLDVARHFGTRMILTNASHGWVEYCIRRFLPACAECIQECNIHYAWDSSEPNISLWKKHYLRAYNNNTNFKRVLGIGDRIDDCEAVRYAFRECSNVQVMKLIDEPSIIQTISQLQHLVDMFHRGGLVMTHCI